MFFVPVTLVAYENSENTYTCFHLL